MVIVALKEGGVDVTAASVTRGGNMGEVVELWSSCIFRAMFLIETWPELVERFAGDHAKAGRAHASLCRDWERIWDATACTALDAPEARSSELSDDALLAEWRRAELDSPLLAIVTGEMERRNLDE